MPRFTVLIALLFAGLAAAAAPAALENQAGGHPSPYLAMHGQDPVHWQLWNREALERARRLNRPLLLSIGYFSCHWCHVMQRESYRDPLLAKLLNEYFIPVKVDRELNPALDAHLIEFVQLTHGQAGWPLNVFLTPEGYPLVGTTYLPRDRFYRLLNALRQRWQADAAEMRQLAQAAMDEWRQLRTPAGATGPGNRPAAERLLEQSERRRDDMEGGFGQQNKFPMVSQLQALLGLRSRHGEVSQDDFIRLTLDNMAARGLHDLVGGGFFRYTTDPGWHVPHYEKMLYDNARLAQLYLQAADVYRSSRYREVGLETLDFMLDEMQRDDGCFISSFSAVDERGREGYAYLWSDAGLKRVLSAAELKAVQAAWFEAGPADQEYGKLPRWQGRPEDIAASLGLARERLDALLASAREKLRVARRPRRPPADGKALAAWNGLALSALVAGQAAGGDRRYRRAAAALRECIQATFVDGDTLVRAREGERVLARATLEDYGLLAQGLWDQGRQDPVAGRSGLALAARLLRRAWKDYYRNDRWLMSDAPLIPMLEGRIALEDGPLPSASAAVTRISGRHPALKGDAAIAGNIEAHLGQVRARLGDSIFWYAGYVELLDTPDAPPPADGIQSLR